MASTEYPSAIQVDVITPEKKFFSGMATMVTVPGYEGEFGVLPGHAPFISLLKPGIITISSEGGGKQKIAVIEGISEAVPERCTVLADWAVDCTNFTSADVSAMMEKAKTALSVAETEEERLKAQKQLALAETLELAA